MITDQMSFQCCACQQLDAELSVARVDPQVWLGWVWSRFYYFSVGWVDYCKSACKDYCKNLNVIRTIFTGSWSTYNTCKLKNA